MRAVVQRVLNAQVAVDGEIIGRIGPGLMVLLGVQNEDTEIDVAYLVEKVVGLRIFEDEDRKMNRSVLETNGEILVVSQFTLLGDVRKGKRPSFIQAADPNTGNRLYEDFVSRTRARGVRVETGRFRTEMNVSLTNQGPVTLILDSRKKF